MYVKKDGVPKYYSNEQRKAAHASMAEKKDGITKHKGFPKYKDGMMKMTPKQKAVAGGMPMEVANKIGIPKKGSNEPMMNYSSFKSYNIKAGGSKNTSFKMRAGSDGPMAKNYGPMLNASEITYEQAKFNASSPATQNLIKAGAPKEVVNNSKKNDVKKFKEKNGITKTYKEAYKTRGKGYQDMDEATYIKKAKQYTAEKNGITKTYKEAYKDADKSKYKTYGEFEKAAKDYNTKKYGTTEPTKYAKGTGRTKEKLASDNKKNVEVKKKEQVKKATVKEKKTPIGPKERTTVKKAKATKKAGVKEAKQKGYETRKDRRAAVSDARKAGRAGVKEARKDKKDLKKAEKNTRKRDKKEVKAAITDAKRAAKIDKLKSKKSTNKRSNKIDDLQAKRKLNSDEPLAKYKK